MKKSLLLSSLSLAGMASGIAAQGQNNYPDLRGQFMQLTGILNYNLIADAAGLITTTLAGNTTIVPTQMANFTWNTTGPADDSTITANIPLPAIGGILALPPLQSTGSFNEVTGAFSVVGEIPGTTSITVGIASGTSTITVTVTVVNPNITLTGQDIVPSTAPGSATITNTSVASLTWTSIAITVLGLATTLLPGSFATIAPWTLSSITPAPSAVTIFGPGLLGGVFALRRRRLSRLRASKADGNNDSRN